MGAAAAVMAVTSATTSVYSGQQQKQAYKMQAQQAGLEAEANITDRTRALNEALATQNAMMGASGRRLESISGVLKGQEQRFESDAKLIRAGAKSQQAQYKMAGKAAETQGITNAVGQLGQGAYQYSMLQGGGS